MYAPQKFSTVQFNPTNATPGGPGVLGLEVKRRDRAPGGAALVQGEAVYLTQWVYFNGGFLEIGTGFLPGYWFYYAGRFDSRGFTWLAQVEITPRDPSRLLEHRFRIERVNAYYNGEWRFTIDGQQLATYYWPEVPYAFSCGLEMYRYVPHPIKIVSNPKWRPASYPVGKFQKLNLAGNAWPDSLVRTPPLCGMWDSADSRHYASDVKSGSPCSF